MRMKAKVLSNIIVNKPLFTVSRLISRGDTCGGIRKQLYIRCIRVLTTEIFEKNSVASTRTHDRGEET